MPKTALKGTTTKKWENEVHKIKSLVKAVLPSGLLRMWQMKGHYISDCKGKFKFGLKAPVKHQLLYIPPSSIEYHAGSGSVISLVLGKSLDQCPCIMNLDWDLTPQKISELPLYRRVKDRILHNKTWEEVGEFDAVNREIETNGTYDKLSSREDVERRYKVLDQLIEEINCKRSLQSQYQLNGAAFREKGGIQVAISRTGEVLKIGGGNHRLAIAQSMDLPVIPVSVVLVHPQSISYGRWQQWLELSLELSPKSYEVGK